MKSVGATNGFVRVPFLVEGALIGCISGLISSGLVALAYNYVMKVISSLMSSFIPLPLSTVIPWTILAFVGEVFYWTGWRVVFFYWKVFE